MGTVFARLKVPAPDGSGALDDHGVHAFIVPLRDEEKNCFPGVEIKDCGYKVQHSEHALLVSQQSRAFGQAMTVAQNFQSVQPGASQAVAHH